MFLQALSSSLCPSYSHISPSLPADWNLSLLCLSLFRFSTYSARVCNVRPTAAEAALLVVSVSILHVSGIYWIHLSVAAGAQVAVKLQSEVLYQSAAPRCEFAYSSSCRNDELNIKLAWLVLSLNAGSVSICDCVCVCVYCPKGESIGNTIRA